LGNGGKNSGKRSSAEKGFRKISGYIFDAQKRLKKRGEGKKEERLQDDEEEENWRIHGEVGRVRDQKKLFDQMKNAALFPGEVEKSPIRSSSARGMKKGKKKLRTKETSQIQRPHQKSGRKKKVLCGKGAKEGQND